MNDIDHSSRQNFFPNKTLFSVVLIILSAHFNPAMANEWQVRFTAEEIHGEMIQTMPLSMQGNRIEKLTNTNNLTFSDHERIITTDKITYTGQRKYFP